MPPGAAGVAGVASGQGASRRCGINTTVRATLCCGAVQCGRRRRTAADPLRSAGYVGYAGSATRAHPPSKAYLSWKKIGSTIFSLFFSLYFFFQNGLKRFLCILNFRVQSQPEPQAKRNSSPNRLGLHQSALSRILPGAVVFCLSFAVANLSAANAARRRAPSRVASQCQSARENVAARNDAAWNKVRGLVTQGCVS